MQTKIDLQKINIKMVSHVNFIKKHKGIVTYDGKTLELTWSDGKKGKFLSLFGGKDEGFHSEGNTGFPKFFTKEYISKKVGVVVENNIVYTKERCEIYSGKHLISIIYLNDNDKITRMLINQKFSSFIEI